jgi:predicted GNAT superfamily acetyltransferase
MPVAELYVSDMAVAIRHVQPSDYGRVIQHVNEWWGGREMAPMLPRLFFIHFESTSFVADREDGTLAGFLIGFLSQADADTAYVHFIGVAPAERGSGLGRELYERFFAAARANGRSTVRCVTSPQNTASLAFHDALGFEREGVVDDYDGAGSSRVLLARKLG